MGKSKRIRSDRAQDVMTSPGKYADIKAAKKARKTTIILICVIAAIIIGSIALIIFSETGANVRMKVLYETEHFEIDGAMATYMYYNTYQIYSAYYGEYLNYFGIDIASEVETNAKMILSRCEAAKAAGYDLTKAELEKIDAQVKEIKENCKEKGVSLSDMYGKGVGASDIKNVLKLQTLSAKVLTDKENVFLSSVLADKDRINEYFENNKSKFLIGDYLKVSVTDSECFEKLKAAKTAEEFKSIFIEYHVKANLLSKYNAKADPDATALDESVFKTANALLKFYLCETEIEGVTLDKPADSLELEELTISKDTFKKVYDKFKAEGDTTTDAMMETLAKVITDMCGTINTSITVKEDFAYPTASSATTTTTTGAAGTTTAVPSDGTTAAPSDGTTAAPSDGTTAAPSDGTTAAPSDGTTAAPADGTTAAPNGSDTSAAEEDKKTPTSAELTEEFNEWFFNEERKENDTFGASDGKSVYFVTEPAVKETYITKNVGHILVKVEDSKDAAQMAEARTKATEILNQFKSGTISKDEFEKHAKENTDDSGIFYNNFKKGKMVAAFEDWAYDEDRKAGDTGIVETEYGCHVMYFIGDGVEAWVSTAAEALVTEDVSAWDKEIATTYPVTVNQKSVRKIFG